MNPTTAALGRAILNLESEAGKMHIEASLARSNGDSEHASFFLSRELQAREDAKMLAELLECPNNRPQDGRVCDCEDAPCCGHYEL